MEILIFKSKLAGKSEIIIVDPLKNSYEKLDSNVKDFLNTCYMITIKEEKRKEDYED